jgi:hypothetical protein
MAQLDPAAIEAEIARRKAQGSWKGDQAPTDTATPAATSTETPAAVDPAALQAEIDRRNSPTGMVTGPSKAFATGVRQGAEGSVGAIGDAPGTIEGGAGWLLKKIGVDPAEAEKAAKAAASGVPDPLHPTIFLKILQAAGIISPEQAAKIGSPTSATVGKVADAAVEKLPESLSAPIQDITKHVPANEFEQFMQTGGNCAGGALMPGGPVARTARVLGPTIATEGAGAAAKAIDPELETAARTIAAIVSGGGVGAAENAFRTRRALRAVNTSPKAVERVQELMLAQGMSPDQAAARMRELGVGAMQVDTGPNVRQEAQQIQARGGRGRGLIDPTLREREANAQPRLEAETTSLVGPEQQKSDVLGALEDRM